MNKTAMKNFAIWARNKLIADVSYDARLIGITAVSYTHLMCIRDRFVDEAHAFKNLFLYTKMRNVAGLSTSEAQKSSRRRSCRLRENTLPWSDALHVSSAVRVPSRLPDPPE